MANNKEEKLFEQFPPVTTEQWEAAITADLKGADYERKLVWRTAEGLLPCRKSQGCSFLGK